jgi:hypothetical protein
MNNIISINKSPLAGLTTAQISALTPYHLQSANTYGGLNHISGGYSLDSVDSNRKYHPDIKKYEVFQSPEDVLALSVTWKRLQEAKQGHNISNLFSEELFKHLTDTDKEMADQIRDYFSKKIMVWKLKNNRFSKFRNDLNEFVHSSDKKVVREDMLGMIYYLPYFQEYDSNLDEVRIQVDSKPNRSLPTIAGESRLLIPLRKIISKRKSGVTNHYWMKDERTNIAVQFVFEASNPLEHIWSSLFSTRDMLEVSGSYYFKNRDDFEYFSIKNWKLENI